MRVVSHWSFSVTGGLVVVRPDRSGIFLLNPAAQLIWEDYVCGLAVADTVKRFQEVFGLPPDIAQRDIEATFAQWNAGLLSLDPPKFVPQNGFEAPNQIGFVAQNCLLNGRRFRILIPSGDLVEEIMPRINHLAAYFDTPDFTLTVPPPTDGLPATARILLLGEMTRLCQPGREVKAILHAGAAGTQSACVLLAGATHSGKSTLCSGLMQSGLTCYSDDSAILDQDFHIAGMPFPIMLREGSWPHFPQLDSAPTQVRFATPVRFLPTNLPPHSPSVPAKALFFVSYDPAASPALTPLTTFEALVLLRDTGFWVDPVRPTIAAFLDWLEALPKFRLPYPDFASACSQLQPFLS